MREGFIHAMLFSGDKLKIVDVELESLNLLVEEMGIYFVKHLKVGSSLFRLMYSISFLLSPQSLQTPSAGIILHSSCRHSTLSNT